MKATEMPCKKAYCFWVLVEMIPIAKKNDWIRRLVLDLFHSKVGRDFIDIF
jgi:hypothetical protein